jgi:hypothetical protein
MLMSLSAPTDVLPAAPPTTHVSRPAGGMMTHHPTTTTQHSACGAGLDWQVPTSPPVHATEAGWRS